MAKLKNKKRGVTLVETVVALTLLSIISVVSISVSIMSIKAEEKNIRSTEISLIVENAVNCFRFSGKVNFSNTFSKTLSDGESLASSAETKETFDTYNLNRSAYSVTITVYENSIKIVVVDKNNQTLFNGTYERSI